MIKRSAEEIVEILNSISKLSVENGELEIWFRDETSDRYGSSGITGFQCQSFTRQLLEFIEDYLLVR